MVYTVREGYVLYIKSDPEFTDSWTGELTEKGKADRKAVESWLWLRESDLRLIGKPLEISDILDIVTKKPLIPRPHWIPISKVKEPSKEAIEKSIKNIDDHLREIWDNC